MSTIAARFAAAVRAARRHRGLSQLALAEKIEGSVDAISAIERCVNTPSLETAAALVRVLQIDANAIFGAAPRAGALSPKRLTREFALQRLAEQVDDTGLELILAMAAAVAKVHSSPADAGRSDQD
jgi:transcriptional regulator with XRE-family HTH domain